MGGLALAMVGAGLSAGVIAGLLGVGGGIVLVPALELAMSAAGVPPSHTMHLAVATALATIIPTSISSARAHHGRGSVDWSLIRLWAGPMLIGSVIGGLMATSLRSTVLSALFGIVCLVITVKMFLPLDHVTLAPRPPEGWRGGVIAALIGGISSMMGIGGGSLSVPAMTLSGEPIHRAVGTAAFFGFVISVPGTTVYLLAASPEGAPWGTVGLVSLIGFCVISPLTFLAAPIGARLAHALSKRQLSLLFALCLGIVAVRMLYRTWLAASA